jgi:NADPH-dependent glutamate synthase beta subunit-like oxidoreductase
MNTRDAVPPIWTTGTTEVFKTGTWRAALPRHIRAPSPCHVACPVDGDIAEWIGRARARDFRGAWDILVRHNPFPAVSGRVCHHPCETACNRVQFDEPLSICKLERFVGDCALAEGWRFPPVEATHAGSVAVVGGGPSGLSAAFHLRRRGYRVTLFDAQPELGGVMRYGIPDYRLPRPVLDGEIARILALGVEVRLGQALTTTQQFERLRRSYDAVYVATGAARPRRLPLLDYAEPWVMDGAVYLAQANGAAPPALGRRVVVVGGGSAAIDVARSARRAGHDVTLVALEDLAQLPAQRDEVAEALEEGIALVHGAMLTGAARAPEGGVTLACVRVRFERAAQHGRFTVTALPDSGFSLRADAVVTAIGQDPDLGPFDAALARDGALLHADARQATSVADVYAGGDVASMARFVTEAIGMGKRAAAAIDDALRARAGQPREQAAPTREAVVPLASINTFYYAKEPRVFAPALDASTRVSGGAEVQRGLDVAQAIAEAGRCFSCGTCIDCDNCVTYCPDLAVRRESAGYVVLADYCKGCGLCVKECPTGSMKMIEEVR